MMILVDDFWQSSHTIGKPKILDSLRLHFCLEDIRGPDAMSTHVSVFITQ